MKRLLFFLTCMIGLFGVSTAQVTDPSPNNYFNKYVRVYKVGSNWEMRVDIAGNGTQFKPLVSVTTSPTLSGQVPQWNGTQWVPTSLSGGSPANLTIGTRTATTVPVLNSNGSGITFPAVDASNAGAATVDMYAKFLESFKSFSLRNSLAAGRRHLYVKNDSTGIIARTKWQSSNATVITDTSASNDTLTVVDQQARHIIQNQGVAVVTTSTTNYTGAVDVTNVGGIAKVNIRGAPSGLAGTATVRLKQEALPIGSGVTQTVATISGAGTITDIWQTMTGAPVNARMQVFVDGESIPSIDIDLGSLFLCHNGATTKPGGFFWDVMHLTGFGRETGSGNGPNIGGHFRYPIPYTNGAIVKLVNSTSAISLYYAQVSYQVHDPNKPHAFFGQRLKSISKNFATEALTFTTTQERDLFITPTGSEGNLVYFGMIEKGAGTGTPKTSFLERDIVGYVDGESTPSINNSGTEDFNFSSFYYQDLRKFYTTTTVLSYFKDSADVQEVNTGVDLLAVNGGYHFASELRLKMLYDGETFIQQGLSLGYLALFYTPVTSAWAGGSSASVPGAPTIGTATGGDAQASITFSPPSSNGGSPIIDYTMTSTPTGITATGGGSPIVVTGLTNGTSYTFKVKARNAVGFSAESAASNAVTPSSGGGGGAVTDLEDFFTDADGTLLAAHTADTKPAGATWTVTSTGTMPIANNGTTSTLSTASMTNSSEGEGLINSGRADGTFEIDITTGPTNHTVRSLMFRAADANNGFILALVMNTAGEKKIELTQRISGVNTVVGSVNIPSLTTSTTYHLKVVAAGTSLVCTLDNANTLNYTTSTNSTALDANTKAGVHIYYEASNGDNGNSRWDHIKVSH
jgi:hypothetical protein